METVHHKPAFDRADPSRKKTVLDAGIGEFAEHGYEKANINVIAKKAGISVGLMYKYFDTKEDLFLTCMDCAIDTMTTEISEVVNSDAKILNRAEQLVRTVQRTSREDTTFVKLYSGITELKNDQHVAYFAEKIERVSYEAYHAFLERAQRDGDIRPDCDTRMFAFFFDSILTTLQFSYVSDYYRERFKIYCWDDVFEDDERVVREAVKFLESAFTFSQAEVKHKNP